MRRPHALAAAALLLLQAGSAFAARATKGPAANRHRGGVAALELGQVIPDRGPATAAAADTDAQIPRLSIPQDLPGARVSDPILGDHVPQRGFEARPGAPTLELSRDAMASPSASSMESARSISSGRASAGEALDHSLRRGEDSGLSAPALPDSIARDSGLAPASGEVREKALPAVANLERAALRRGAGWGIASALAMLAAAVPAFTAVSSYLAAPAAAALGFGGVTITGGVGFLFLLGVAAVAFTSAHRMSGLAVGLSSLALSVGLGLSGAATLAAMSATATALAASAALPLALLAALAYLRWAAQGVGPLGLQQLMLRLPIVAAAAVAALLFASTFLPAAWMTALPWSTIVFYSNIASATLMAAIGVQFAVAHTMLRKVRQRAAARAQEARPAPAPAGGDRKAIMEANADL